jgi:hypothetical protein
MLHARWSPRRAVSPGGLPARPGPVRRPARGGFTLGSLRPSSSFCWPARCCSSREGRREPRRAARYQTPSPCPTRPRPRSSPSCVPWTRPRPEIRFRRNGWATSTWSPPVPSRRSGLIPRPPTSGLRTGFQRLASPGPLRRGCSMTWPRCACGRCSPAKQVVPRTGALAPARREHGEKRRRSSRSCSCERGGRTQPSPSSRGWKPRPGYAPPRAPLSICWRDAPVRRSVTPRGRSAPTGGRQSGMAGALTRPAGRCAPGLRAGPLP